MDAIPAIKYVNVSEANTLTSAGVDFEQIWYITLDNTASAMGQTYENILPPNISSLLSTTYFSILILPSEIWLYFFPSVRIL